MEYQEDVRLVAQLAARYPVSLSQHLQRGITTYSSSDVSSLQDSEHVHLLDDHAQDACQWAIMLLTRASEN